jgi:hypothetical protein
VLALPRVAIDIGKWIWTDVFRLFLV